MSNILVIGHSVLDKIIHNGTLIEKPGGIYHAINTFTHLPKFQQNVFLATQISRDSYKYFNEVYKNVNMEYCEWVNEIPTVTLNLFDDKERNERYSMILESISFPTNFNFSTFDLILINMVSGLDVAHKDIYKIKKNCNCEIYFDVHTLSRGLDNDGNRVFRKIPEVEKWLKNIDILQMNKNEMLTLWNIPSEKDNINRLFELGVRKVIITKGSKGATLYDNMQRYHFSPIEVAATNFVGCGDSFGAAFCYDYSINKDLFSASKFANLVAGIITSYNSTERFNNLGEDIANRLD